MSQIPPLRMFLSQQVTFQTPVYIAQVGYYSSSLHIWEFIISSLLEIIFTKKYRHYTHTYKYTHLNLSFKPNWMMKERKLVVSFFFFFNVVPWFNRILTHAQNVFLGSLNSWNLTHFPLCIHRSKKDIFPQHLRSLEPQWDKWHELRLEAEQIRVVFNDLREGWWP